MSKVAIYEKVDVLETWFPEKKDLRSTVDCGEVRIAIQSFPDIIGRKKVSHFMSDSGQCQGESNKAPVSYSFPSSS